MKSIFTLMHTWFQTNKKMVFVVAICYSLSVFFYLNYINWSSGVLLSGSGGIQYASDSSRYIKGAENLIFGQAINGFKNSYIGYMAVLALGKIMGWGLEFTLVLQIIFNLLAGVALYHLTLRISNSKAAATLALSVYLISPLVVSWVLYIHTESLFSSFLILSIWSLFVATEKRKISSYFLAIILVAISASIRPNGWLLVPIAIFFMVQFSTLHAMAKTIIYCTSFLLFFIFLQKSPWFTNKGDIERISTVLLEGEIICDKNTYHLPMPQESFSNKNDLLESTLYLLKHPIASAQLASLRIGSELFPILRPWLSFKFKLRFLFWTLPAYVFALFCFFNFKGHRGVQILLLVLLSQLLIIAASFSEREFRFLVPLLPLFYLAGACGFYFLLKKWTDKLLKVN